ncbi:hypothetical protein QBC40DRAFT_352353 [Triangularia verruculosa]|uniref:Uncharacterized protein n=1 Tax=Triangularia verruculosa TaxID=2587418 RepID=A0AAN6X7U9_9PEZI|nr:hypothetical protein QBC40DRAFT_352353 [Triangularia verruculosa]
MARETTEKTALTMKAITASLSPRDIANAREVSDLLLKIYQTLIHMQYLPADLLTPGPHDLTHLFPLFQELQLAPQIIYLYSILPYVSSHCHDFYQGGYFADFRVKREVEDGRNTMYCDDRREQMRPWMTPLSLLCNHMCVLFYDARRHRIGIFDQCDGWTRDRGLKGEEGGRTELRTVDELEAGGDSDGSDSGAANNDSDSEENERRPQKKQKRDGGHPRLGCGSKGPNIYDDMPSRPAGDVLRDILREYETLEEVPWVYEHGGGGDWPEGVKSLFFKHGWPRADFAVEAFNIDRMRLAALEDIQYRAEEPFRVVEREMSWVDRESPNSPEVLLLKRQIATAETPDEEWLARYQLWQKEQQFQSARKALKKAEAERDRLCPDGKKPGDDPKDTIMLEIRKWRQDIARKEESIANDTEQAEMLAAGLMGSHAPTLKSMTKRIEESKTQLELLQKVLKACEKDAERLCPGMEELPVEDEDSKRISLFHNRAFAVNCHQESIEDIEGFMARVPKVCTKTMELLDGEIERLKESIKHSHQWWDRHDEAIKEAEQRKEALAAIKKEAAKVEG